VFITTKKKAKVQFRHNTEGFGTSSETAPLNETDLVDYLRQLTKRYGKVVIEHVDQDGEIHATTPESLHHENMNERIDDIQNVILDYIKGRAVSMEGYAVFSDGILKGVFGKESHAELKRKNLISKGHLAESIAVKPIEVGSFQDFE